MIPGLLLVYQDRMNNEAITSVPQLPNPPCLIVYENW